MTELPFMGKGEHAYGPLDLIHSDVCGPMSINAKGGFVYFITFMIWVLGSLLMTRFLINQKLISNF